MLDFIHVAVPFLPPYLKAPVTSRTFAVIAVLAVVLRGLLALTQPALLTEDADGYLAHARLLTSEHRFLGPYTLQPTAFRPPAYPLLLAAAMAIGLSAPLAVFMVHVACTLLCLLAIVWLSRQLSFSKRKAVIAALLVALDPLLLRYSLQPMTEVPCAAFLTLSLVFILKGCQTEDSPRASRAIALSGLLLALGALTRPTLLVLAVLLTLSLVPRGILRAVRSPTQLAAMLKPALTFALAFALGLCPWIIRNAVQFHAFLPATTHGGYTLALGNNADFYRDVIRGQDAFPWEGRSLERWQRDSLQQAIANGIDTASELAMDTWYYELALRSIRQDPLSFLKACLLRIRRFWALTAADHVSKLQNLLLVAWYGTLWTGLAATAIAEVRKRHSPPFTSLWLSVVAFTLMHTVYWTDARMRTPIMPIVLLLALHGWSILMEFAGHVLRSRKSLSGA